MEWKEKEDVFARLVTENKGIIYKICRSYCADASDQEDLAQEIIYHLWKSFSGFKPEFKFSTWMYRVALNVAISYYRREKKHQFHQATTDQLVVFEKSDDDETEANLALLQGFINELKELDRAIILLYLEEKTQKEIADITGFTETNVATRINRIKEKLRQKFANR